MSKFKIGDKVSFNNSNINCYYSLYQGVRNIYTVIGYDAEYNGCVLLKEIPNTLWLESRLELVDEFKGLETAYDYKNNSELKFPETTYKTQSVEELKQSEEERINASHSPVVVAFKALTGISITDDQYDILKALEQLYRRV